MKPADLADDFYTYQKGKILLGHTKDGRLIGIDDNRHIATIAGSRAGKTATCLLPNLLAWTGSVLAIDPKGELATNTAEHRAKMGQDVIILDPFNEVGRTAPDVAAKYAKRFDPLSEIKAGKVDDIIDNAAMIADALIVPSDGQKTDHWSLSAKNAVRGFILWALAQEIETGTPAALNQVRKWLTMPLENDDETAPDMLDLFGHMMRSDAFEGVVAGVGGTMYGKPEDERGSILSTAVEQTAFLDSKPMHDHLAASDFPSLRVLKQRPTTIYLVLPASRMATHYRWLRVIITLAMAALENEENRLPSPVLFLLEEFPQLGYMRQIEAAAGLMAGYDVKLWTVIQDLSQLKAQYRDSWETFLGNAGIVEAFGNSDMTTLDYLSKRLGNTMAQQIQPDNPNLPAQQGGAGRERETIITAPLMAPHEIAQAFTRKRQNKLVLYADANGPFQVRRIYWKDLL
jgi:type IV secretion system protein VirD4